jgi:hypothetical protein
MTKNRKITPKKAIVFALLGAIGTATVVAYNLYKLGKQIDDIDWDNLNL